MVKQLPGLEGRLSLLSLPHRSPTCRRKEYVSGEKGQGESSPESELESRSRRFQPLMSDLQRLSGEGGSCSCERTTRVRLTDAIID